MSRSAPLVRQRAPSRLFATSRVGCPLDVVAKILLGARHHEFYRWFLVGSGQEPKMIMVPKPYRIFHDSFIRAMPKHRRAPKSGSPKWVLAWLWAGDTVMR